MAIHAQGALVVDLNLAHVHAPLDQLGTRSRQVGDDELQVLEGARRHLNGARRRPNYADGNRAS